MKKWKDIADHKAGCPYKGVAVYGTKEEMAKYHSGVCPGCNRPVKWEEDEPSGGLRPSKDIDHP
ncbi:MAG: hypothetical protein ACM33C_03190 [Syntrophaceae bacterium]